MDTQTRIRKIIEETNCSFDVARAANEEAGGDLDAAIIIARKKGNLLFTGGVSGTYVEEPARKKHITEFSNGVLVEDRFYDFSKDSNIELKQMLAEKTFDASILGVEGESAEVIYTDKTGEEYREPRAEKPRAGSSFVGEGRTLGGARSTVDADVPDTLDIAKDGDVVFKAMVGHKHVTVRMHGTQTIHDFLEFMKRFSSSAMAASCGEREMHGDDSIGEVANKLVFLKKQ